MELKGSKPIICQESSADLRQRIGANPLPSATTRNYTLAPMTRRLTLPSADSP